MKSKPNNTARRTTVVSRQEGQLMSVDSLDRVNCPGCGEEITLSSIMTARLEQSTSQLVEREIEAARCKWSAEHTHEMERLESELAQVRTKATAAQKAQLSLIRREKELDDLIRTRELELEERLLKELEKMRASERRRAEIEAKRDLREREEELALLRNRLAAAEKNEAELRLKNADVQARENALELEVQRRIDDLRGRLTVELKFQAEESAAVEVQRRELEINRLREQIAQISRSGVPGEIAGESLEVVLRRVLTTACPLDLIEDVPRGQRGADLLQVVRNSAEAAFGKVCWEIKNAKAFDKNWISKLKDAQRATDSDVAALVTSVLPEGIRHLGLLHGVWVCSPGGAAGLAVLIRHMLLRIGEVRLVSETRESRLQALSDYLGSNAFRLAAESVIALVNTMEQELQTEEKGHARQWARRRQYLLALGGRVGEVIGALEGASQSNLIGEMECSAPIALDPAT